MRYYIKIVKKWPIKQSKESSSINYNIYKKDG